jgi:MFS family permease
MYLVVALSISIHACYVGSKIVVSLLALELGASPVVVGVLAAFYALVPLLLGVHSGRLADTIGMRLPLLAGAICTGVAMLTGFLWPRIGGLFVLALLMGTAFVLFNVSIQNMAGGIGRPEERARNFSVLAIGYAFSSFIGPTFAGFSIDHFGHPATFGFFGLLTLLPIGVLTFHHRFTQVGPKPSAIEDRSALDLLRNAPLRLLIVTSGLTVAAQELLAFYLPIYAHSLGHAASTIGLILGAYAVAAFLIRFALPLLLGRLGVQRVMVGSVLIAATAFLLLPFTEQAALLFVLAFTIGLGMGCTQPILMTLSYEKSPKGRTGEVTGLRLTANNVARVVIPLVSGALGAAFGAAPVFWINAINLAVVSWISRK